MSFIADRRYFKSKKVIWSWTPTISVNCKRHLRGKKQTCNLVPGRKKLQIGFCHLQELGPVLKIVQLGKSDVLETLCPTKMDIQKATTEKRRECCSSVPRTSLWHISELRTIWQDIQRYPIAANWEVTWSVPWFSINGVPKCHRHLACFSNCELSVL